MTICSALSKQALDTPWKKKLTYITCFRKVRLMLFYTPASLREQLEQWGHISVCLNGKTLPSTGGRPWWPHSTNTTPFTQKLALEGVERSLPHQSGIITNILVFSLYFIVFLHLDEFVGYLWNKKKGKSIHKNCVCSKIKKWAIYLEANATHTLVCPLKRQTAWPGSKKEEKTCKILLDMSVSVFWSVQSFSL